MIAVGAGTLKLTARGGLDGSLQVTVVGIEKILKMLDIDRIMSEGQVGATLERARSADSRARQGSRARARRRVWLASRSASGPCSKASRRWRFRVRFADGAVFLGPFQVGVVPPLF